MLARKTMLILAGNVVGGVLGVVALKLIALHFGATTLGEVSFAMGFVGMAYVLQDLGFTQAHVKFVSEGRDLGRCMSTFFAIKVVLTALFSLAVLAVLGVYQVVLGKDLVTTTPLTLAIVLATNVVTSLRGVSRFTLDGRQETAKGQLLTFVENVTRVLATVLLAGALVASADSRLTGWMAGSPVSEWTKAHPAEALALTWLCAMVASALYGVYATRDVAWGPFDRDLAREYFRFAFPFMLLSLAGVAAANIDIFTVGYFWSATEVGYLTGAQRITVLLSMVYVAVGTLLFPHISSLHASDRPDEVRAVFEQTLRYVGLVVTPAVVVVVAYPEEVIRLLLADSFTRGAAVLVVLTLSTLLTSLTGPYVALVSGMNRPVIAAKVGGLTAVLVVVLNLVLVPTSILGVPLAGMKALGAAWATLLATLVYFVLLRVAAHRLVGVGGAWSNLLRQWVAGAVMLGALWGLSRVIPGFGHWYTLAAAGAAGCLVYLAVLWALREITAEDWRYFRDLLNPAPTLRYLRQELLGR